MTDGAEIDLVRAMARILARDAGMKGLTVNTPEKGANFADEVHAVIVDEFNATPTVGKWCMVYVFPNGSRMSFGTGVEIARMLDEKIGRKP